MSTMRDVAARAGVSVQTVSNVVNDRLLMSPATKQRVLQAMDELGYTSNHRVRGPRNRTTQTLAFIVVDPAERFLADEFHDVVLAGISDALRDRGYSLLIQQVLDPYTELHDLAPLVQARVDGAIVTGSRPLFGIGASPARRRRVKVPLVLLEQNTADPAICSIRADNYQGAADLTRHLIQRGRTNFAFVRGSGEWPAVSSRLHGIQATLGAYGLSCDLVVSTAWEPEAAYQAVLPLLHAHPGLDAIIAANDVLALGAMKAVRKAGRSIPGDVAVAGFDDFAFSTCIEPALTTVAVPGYEMGRTAAEMILSCRANGSFPQQKVCFPATLIVRDSS